MNQELFTETYCFESFSYILFCVKVCMQINADWKRTSCILDDMLNEVNINMMNKMTLI